VKERAQESGVSAFSYDELFAKFEKFTPYLTKVLSDNSIVKLVQNYKEPLFNDIRGVDHATKWLNRWKSYAPDEAKWLIVLGEYGTGKTSLTRILQYRWISEYHIDPSAPIPVRIELRNFSRQFDANGLLHHFLDTNGLGHVPIEFMTHLIRTGRVILLLEGYDEMAQFMNGRERRACLSALAELAKDGAKGILTSRPNYFSDLEELNVFEALYRKLEQQKYHLSKSDEEVISQERAVDNLIERYVLERYERALQDLTPEQTRSLVRRSLARNQDGQKLVLAILGKVFREEVAGARQALSGKPVIIAYLLELVAELQKDSNGLSVDNLTEWQIYKLIVDRLMMRDFTRSPLSPAERRSALQQLALKLSSRGVVVASESLFLQIIDEQFSQELRRLSPEERRTRRTELFEDLRSSATLTRAIGTGEDGWVFSHNSLREFLAVELFLNGLFVRSPREIDIPVSEAMRSFVSSMDKESILKAWQILAELWVRRSTNDLIGGYLALMWESASHLTNGFDGALEMISADQNIVLINDVVLRDINFSCVNFGDYKSLNASNSSISESVFDGLSLVNGNFKGVIADSVSFRDCDLNDANFESCFIFECDFSGASVRNANFHNMDIDSSIILVGPEGKVSQLTGSAAIGYLRFAGAITSPVEDIHIYVHHSKFSILEKICERVSEQKHSQLRGLTQRGEARTDPPFARAVVDKLVSLGWATIDKNDLVSATPAGRPIMQRVAARDAIAGELVQMLNGYSSA